MALSDKQRGVVAGMAGAAAVAVVAMAAAIVTSPAALRPAPDILGRLGFVAAWDLLVVVWLLAAIGNLARHRFFTPADIDGGGLTAGTDTARINLKAGTAESDDQTHGQSPGGNVEGEGFRLYDRGARIVFTVKAKAVLYGSGTSG